MTREAPTTGGAGHAEVGEPPPIGDGGDAGDGLADPRPAEDPGPVVSTSGTPEARTTSGGVQRALRALGSVVAPTTLIVALLYWFGEVRVRTQAEDLGVDHSVFGFSTQDYVRRSVSSLYLPIGLLLLGALASFAAHWALARWAGAALPAPEDLRRRRSLWWIVAAVAAAGVVCFGTGVYRAGYLDALVPSSRHRVWPPVFLGLGVALLGYSAFLWWRYLSRPKPPRPGAPDASWVGPLCLVLVALLVSVALFWAVSDYAEDVGHRLTRELVNDDLARRPNVVLFSERRLHLDGATEVPVGEGDEAGFRFRYDGLKLLLFSGGKYFLLPATWPGTEQRERLIVLRDDDSIRLEFFS